MQNTAAGKGWVTADIQADTSKPVSLNIEAGYKINNTVGVYGDAWMQPTEHTAGADLVADFNHNVNLFAGGSWNYNTGQASAEAGVQWKF